METQRLKILTPHVTASRSLTIIGGDHIRDTFLNVKLTILSNHQVSSSCNNRFPSICTHDLIKLAVCFLVPMSYRVNIATNPLMWITHKHTTNFEYFAPWVLVSSPCRSDIRVKKNPVKTNDSASGKDCKENLKLYWVGSLSNDIQLYTINQIYKTLRILSTSRLNFMVKNVKGSCKDYFGRKQVTAQIHHHCESNFINSLGYARQWHVAIHHKFDIL